MIEFLFCPVHGLPALLMNLWQPLMMGVPRW